MPYQVAVCGPQDCTDADAEHARRVGRLLAEHGVVVFCGGGGGVMAAAAEGARSGGGLVIGIVPGDRREAADEHLSAVVATGMGQARNAVLVTSADAVIVIGGSWGTLNELALAKRRGTPVISLGGWTVLATDGTPVPGIDHQPDPEAAVARAIGRNR